MVGLILTIVASAFSYLIAPLASRRIDESRVAWQKMMTEDAANRERVPRRAERRLEQERLLGLAEARLQEPHMYQRMALLPLLGIQAFILFLLGTGQVSGGMTAERDDGMVDYQRLTPMKPMAKLCGYLMGLPVREWVLFFSTLPFTCLALWRGQVPSSAWVPVALVFFTSVILYHLTGLVTGTVMKNRRWAFLLCMGLIFLLYTIVPQGARMGLPFLRYVTMWPAAMDAAHIYPAEQVRIWELASGHVAGAGVEFFHWRFSELTFTLIVQGSFILTMLVMVWRKWRQADSHLLSKAWALLVFAWLCILPIGNALPGIADGSLFRSRKLRDFLDGEPRLPARDDALLMGGFYGLLMLVILLCLVIMLTPGQDSQARGLRRAAKLGRRSAPWLSDESSAFLSVVVLTLGGAASWAWFTRSLLGSTWFMSDPGWITFAYAFALLAPVTLGFHALLESRGGRWPFLGTVFLGIVPILAGLIVLAAAGDSPGAAAAMVAGASPLTWPLYGIEQLIDWPPLPQRIRGTHDAIHDAIRLWPAIYGIAAVLFMISLAGHWRKRRQSPVALPSPTRA